MFESRRQRETEQIHLPGSTLVPLATAIGLAVAMLGLISARFLIVVGAVILLVAVARWISEVRSDISNLPD